MAYQVHSIVYQYSILVLHMGVSINVDTPKWIVYFMDNAIWKWMITRGTPISGNLHMVI